MALKLLVEILVIWAIFPLYVWLFTRPNGPVDAAFWYPQELQDRFCELGLTTHERIERRHKVAGTTGILAMLVMYFICIVLINGTRSYLSIFAQTYLLFELMELWDVLVIDSWWVAVSGWWDIPGTEDLMHLYKDWRTNAPAKYRKLLATGIPVSAVFAGIFWALAHVL